MLISFVKGEPALLIKKERALVVGDLHIGLNLKFGQEGVHFEKATERLADRLVALYQKSGAGRLVLLGDVKESITRLRFAEYKELRSFFGRLEGIDTEIAKGNHDGGLEMVLKGLGFDIPVRREILVDQATLAHGNSWPSEEAMQKRYLIVGHGHFAVQRGERREKVWLVANAGAGMRRKYKRYNKGIRLVVAPSFNELVVGSVIGEETKGYLPMFKNDVFSFEDANVYGLENKLYGKTRELVRRG